MKLFKRLWPSALTCAAIFLTVCVLTVDGFAAEGPGSVGDLIRYNKNMDIWFMLMLVAFLMTFIRKFEWGVYLAVILTAASSIVTYLAIRQFVLGAPPVELLSQQYMIAGVVCAITVVIAIGVFLGTIKTWQFLLVGVLFAPVFHLLEFFLFTSLPSVAGGPVTDPGGGILVHLFAAYFGFGVAMAIREKRVFDEPMYTTKHSLSLTWLAAMLLFILWPSFVTSLLLPEEATCVMINCYMSGFGSMVSAYLVCFALDKEHKVNPVVYIYAMLGGPVASSSTLLLANPWTSLLVGIVAGALSALAFTYLQGWLCNKLGVLDVMGVHNLHGVCGWISLITGAMLAGDIVNIWAGLLTCAYGIVSGLVVGVILRATRGKMEVLFSDQAEFTGYNPDPRMEPDERVVM